MPLLNVDMGRRWIEEERVPPREMFGPLTWRDCRDKEKRVGEGARHKCECRCQVSL